MPHPIATYQCAEWAYNHVETLAEGETRPSCMLGSAEQLPQRIADMRAQGYVIHGITLHTYCATCQGSGRVPKRGRLYAWKVCTACKGHDGPLASEPYAVPGE